MKFERAGPPLFLATFLFIGGCSFQQRDAARYLEQGQYIAAEQAYKNILAEKPLDPRALEGIHRAREGLIDKRLLEVRFLRLAGNYDEALEALGQVLDDENSWKLYPRGAVFFTQREEQHEELKRAVEVIYKLLDSNHPVPARLYYEKRKHIFEQGETLTDYKTLGIQIDSHGKKSCSNFLAGISKSQPYYQVVFNLKV